MFTEEKNTHNTNKLLLAQWTDNLWLSHLGHYVSLPDGRIGYPSQGVSVEQPFLSLKIHSDSVMSDVLTRG